MSEWLCERGFADVCAEFVENEVDGAILTTLTRDDLELLGISQLGARVDLLEEIRALNPLPSSNTMPTVLA